MIEVLIFFTLSVLVFIILYEMQIYQKRKYLRGKYRHKLVRNLTRR